MKVNVTAYKLRATSSCPVPGLPAMRPILQIAVLLLLWLPFLFVNACVHTNSVTQTLDSDRDGVLDSADNCPRVPNQDQADLNGDGWGNACDDIDGDQILDAVDDYPLDPDNDLDGDGLGADPFDNCRFVCANCKELAEICNEAVDNCPYIANETQEDRDKDGIGDVCAAVVGTAPPACHPIHNPCETPPLDDTKAIKDRDNDGVPDSEDNCPRFYNPYDVDTDGDKTYDAQLNTDNDAFGDPCDDDDDNDGILDDGDGSGTIGDNVCKGGNIADCDDNCRLQHNSTQDNLDCDEFGDVCDTDRDGDGHLDAYEISIAGTSPTHADSDGDRITDGPELPACPQGLLAGPDPNPLGDPALSIAFEVLDANGADPLADVKQTWLPSCTWNTGTRQWDSDHIKVKATLRDTNNATIAFEGDVTFNINNPSNHPGMATNDTETNLLKPEIDMSFNDTVIGDSTDTKKNIIKSTHTGEIVDVYVFDFGGSATIEVSTTYRGNIVSGQIQLPADTDHDNLPDEWEKRQRDFDAANANTFGTQKTDDNADIDTSLDNSHKGDGLNNFQEYRGIIFDPENADHSHERLNPHRKNLFVRGDNYANSIPKNTLSHVLPFSVDYAAVYGLPEETPNAFEEAGIDLHDVTGMPSFSDSEEPPNIDVLIVTNKTVKNADNLIETLAGIENGFINHPSSLKPRYWTWDLKGASFIGNHALYAIFLDPNTGVTKHGTETYHLCLMHYFYNRPYMEDTDNTTACRQGYSNKLDTLDNVEDFYKENGTNPPDKHGNKKEDRCIVDNNILDGDRMDPNWKQLKWGAEHHEAGQDYSAFDADADGRVENPVVTDAAGLDPGQQDPGEYTSAQVQLHTVLHEMGHAVGMDEQHTADPSCLMYQNSINWNRAGHFSPAARSQILIHND